MRFTELAFAVVAAVISCACSAGAQVMGTGSGFAAPIYIRWAHDARSDIGLEVNYQATGSGVGQTQAVAGTVDFGASDVPMEADKLEAANILQFPTVVGGLDVIVNLPNVKPNTLRLNGAVLAGIYMGKITRWDDPRIAELNPHLSLPGINIVPIHHATASGTTFALSRYLSKISDAWKTRMGVGMTLDWPSGFGVPGSVGAANKVPLTEGSIGYAESSYVSKNNLTSVLLLNKAGKYVAPNAVTFAAAAANADWESAKNFAVDLTDMPGDQSWPLVTATFVLVPKNQAKSRQFADVLKFYGWAFAHGDDAASGLDYVPLPSSVKDRIEAAWRN